MATSLGEGLSGFQEHITRFGGTVEYVVVASTVSLVLGGVVLPRIFKGGSPPPPAQCPPCQCFCACGPLPPASH